MGDPFDPGPESAVPFAPAPHGPNGDQDQHDQTQQDQAARGCHALDLAPRRSTRVADQDEPRAPDEAADAVPEEEAAIGDAGHPCQTGNQHPKGRGEPPDEHGPAALSGEVRPGLVQIPRQAMADEGEPAEGAVNDGVPPPPSDEVAGRVPGDRAEDGSGDGRGQGDPSLEGENAAQEDRDLAGEDEADEGRCLERREGEDQGKCGEAVQRQDAVGDARHQGHRRHRPMSAPSGQASSESRSAAEVGAVRHDLKIRRFSHCPVLVVL